MLLVLNAGSSSLKFALFPQRGELAPLLQAEIAGIGQQARFRLRSGGLEGFAPDAAAVADHGDALDAVLGGLGRVAGLQLAAVGHRVVHGGTRFAAATRIDREVADALRAMIPLAPQHQPFSLAAIDRLATSDPQLPQVACFDTAFHRQQPAVAQQFALPRELTASGILRYGFHGLSYQYIADALGQRLPADARRRVIVAHLGNGASLCAMHDGCSIATSMGFSPLDGVPMGSRCGSLDPGVVLHLLRERGMSVDAVEDLLSRRSGLLGVSGISSDMRTLLESDAPEAAEAVELFAYRVNREIGSLTAALGGLDALVFTAGIGEHAAPVRQRIGELARWSGLRLDAERNRAGAERISSDDSAVSAWVIATDEESVIAAQTRAVLG
jgi:acetate kinase